MTSGEPSSAGISAAVTGAAKDNAARPKVVEKVIAPEEVRKRQIREIGTMGQVISSQLGKSSYDLWSKDRAQWAKSPNANFLFTLWLCSANTEMPVNGDKAWSLDGGQQQMFVPHGDNPRVSVEQIKGYDGQGNVIVKLHDVKEDVSVERSVLLHAHISNNLPSNMEDVPPEQQVLLALLKKSAESPVAPLPEKADQIIVEAAQSAGYITVADFEAFATSKLSDVAVPAGASIEVTQMINIENTSRAEMRAQLKAALEGKTIVDFSTMEAVYKAIGVPTGNFQDRSAAARTSQVEIRKALEVSNGKPVTLENGQTVSMNNEVRMHLHVSLAQAMAEENVYDDAGKKDEYHGTPIGTYYFQLTHGEISPAVAQPLVAALRTGDTTGIVNQALKIYEEQVNVAGETELQKQERTAKVRKNWENVGINGGRGILFLFMPVLTGNKPKPGGQ